jgi:hypothetical protein
MQDVFLSMPLLTHLTIRQKLTGQNGGMLAAVRLDMLRSLIVHMDLCHAWLLKGCTQLQSLTMATRNVRGVSAIAQLVGLTQLRLHSSRVEPLFSAEEQAELGSALAALSNLQSLSIRHAPPGPVTQAISQLTRLTELALDEGHSPGPLVLPSCVMLTLDHVNNTSVQHLATIEAPQLQHLDVELKVQPSDLDALGRLCRGVLRACGSLLLGLHAAPEEDTVALMAVLNKDWQPSAEALQPIRSSLAGSSSNKDCRQWRLTLCLTHVSRQCLELLPKGLGALHLRWVLSQTRPCCPPALVSALYLQKIITLLMCCPSYMLACCPDSGCTLDPDSLDRLPQLASLWFLGMILCTGVTLASLERLFSTAVQGCLLTVSVTTCQELSPEAACTQMRQRVVAQRGSRDTPVLC